MRAKLDLRRRAEILRKKGLSYTEIQKEIPVSKSSLSLWLSEIKLTKQQYTRLREKSKANQHLGAKANKQKRIQRTKILKKRAKKEIGKITNKEFFFIGTMLYWAEGAKQKRHNPSERVSFNNSDPFMVKIFLKWLFEAVKVKKEAVDFSIYSHDNIKDREEKIKSYWSEVTGFSEAKFDRIYYKKDKKKKYRKNQGKNYYGLLRITVLRSTDLNRRISGWIEGVCIQCGVV